MTAASKTRVQQVPTEFVQGIIDDSLALDDDELAGKIRRLGNLTRLFSSPTVYGRHNIPEGPVLFISNHSTMALDVLVAAPVLLETCGRPVRAMNDELFYRTRRTRDWSIGIGAVMGHRDVGDAMFKAGKDLLLFPGGAYEANKDLHQRYTLQWKQRMGFVRMAAAHGVPIVPMGIVGPDEWFGRYLDRGEVEGSWLGKLLRLAGASEEYMKSDQLPPIPRGVFGTLLPKPQASYVAFGEPIDTSVHRGKRLSKAKQEQLRDLTRDRLQDCINQMLLKQAQGRDSVSVVRRFLSFY